MIHPQPSWTYEPARPKTSFEADIHLFPHCVAGARNSRDWFLLDRNTGEVRWETRFWRPNRICGLAGDVLIATENRSSDGPWAAEFGIYGISAADGRLLWTSHAPGAWRPIVRWLDFVPGFTNDLRDRPLRLEGGEVLTHTGRRLDAATGADVGRHEVPATRTDPWDSFSTHLLSNKEVEVADLGTLVNGRPGEPEEPGVVGAGPLRFYLRAPDGGTLWEFDAEREERIEEPGSWGLSFDYCHPYIYMLAGDRPRRYGTGGSLFRFLALDLRGGDIVQDVPFGPEPFEWCHMDACDENSVLISTRDPAGSFRLLHFDRVAAG